MTWAEISAGLYRIVDESTTGHWPAATATVYAKQAEVQLCTDIKYFRKKTSTNYLAGATSVIIPTDTITIKEIWCGGDTPLTERTEEQLFDYYGEAWQGLTGTPIFYIREGSTIVLVPLPDAAGTVVFKTICTPAQAEADVSPITPAIYHFTILWYAVYLCYIEDQANLDKANFYLNIYLNDVEKIKGQLIPKDKKRQAKTLTKQNLTNYWGTW